MAELEEIIELGEEVGEEVGEEAAEEAAEEEVAEEMAEVRENVGRLGRCINALKEINWGQVVKQVAKFVAKNVVIGGILWGVTVGLNKLIGKSSGSEKLALQTKQEKIKAMAQLLSDISECFKKLADWIEKKKNITIDVGSGITVPLPDVLIKYTKPLEKVSVV